LFCSDVIGDYLLSC